ncbi:velvet protein [Trapelia coarctata]|nr:velvet protein [Trapelia coarctata]
MANVIAVSNETNSSVVRITKDGRKLCYEMKVLQQPQRARACGSGAKSSADRRPVDPPPVVELRVLEGDAKTDITFSHNANFFLYTTLESARPIAQGRGNALPAPYPVLTGMPVAGMAYLDRPSPAGYFIFPDLSVRHEGKYRLSFNLFEELKEARDADAEPAFNSPDHPNNNLLRNSPMAPQSHVHFRLEVKSEPFVVFSAKKFPGLAESTALSRVVAEQGCRVRIRRDVRMRRRDNKASKDYEDYEEDGAGYGRTERYGTPDTYAQQPVTDRARSPTSVPQPAPNGYSSHLSFGGSSAPQYQAPTLPASNSAMPQPSSSYVAAGASYQYQSSAQPRQMNAGQSYGYSAGQPYQQHQYTTSQPYCDSSEYKHTSDVRRTSIPQVAPSYAVQPQGTYTPTDIHSSALHQNYYPQTSSSVAPRAATPSNVQQLPPLKTLQPPAERKYDQPQSATVMSGPVPTSSVQQTWDQTQSPFAYPSTSHPPTDAPTRLGKRAYGSVFDTTHINEPIHGGGRPNTARHGQGVAQIELDDGTLEDEEEMPNLKLLSYRRADGSRKHKKCPSPIAG